MGQTVQAPAPLPSHTRVLVIGGGPAGSYCASVLARDDIEVTVLEASRFPRYHIGESMLPSLRPFLRYIDADNKVAAHGFTPKRGAAFQFNQFKHEGYTDFVNLDANSGAWNVIRSEFDEILLSHAAGSGATVFQERKVTRIGFDAEDSSRPVSADYEGPSGQKGTIHFDYLIDASGRKGIMSTKYLKNRNMNSSLKNIATWGYWTGGKAYAAGTYRNNAPFFEALTDESGWAWYIPLHDSTFSVGFVLDSESNTKKKAGRGIKEHYLAQLEFLPKFRDLLSDAKLHDLKQGIQSATDYSYSASSYAGPYYRLIGDASAFIDPFFSSGVHLALSGGFTAAVSIAASIRGHCSEEVAWRYHDKKVGVSYTRFLVVVLGAYKQIRAQSLPVLSDINSDNFDRAFDLIRPVIQGTVDVKKPVGEAELQRTMDFVSHILVTPATPEMISTVYKQLSQELLDPHGRVMLEDEIDALTDDEEARIVLREINARKGIHDMYGGPQNLAKEEAGLVANTKRGQLGLSLANYTV
ncbi:FAD/NAD(P)-binding domain-containing protein [Hymenopellis radicata]|nr:FAD/NAD(P)-binding domain-containing protein [Hymenopellis radicata]